MGFTLFGSGEESSSRGVRRNRSIRGRLELSERGASAAVGALNTGRGESLASPLMDAMGMIDGPVLALVVELELPCVE